MAAYAEGEQRIAGVCAALAGVLLAVATFLAVRRCRGRDVEESVAIDTAHTARFMGPVRLGVLDDA